MSRLVFGNCVFDRERRELTRRGSPVHAGPKSLLLLKLLMDSRPRALTKEEIHKRLWPDTFVSDATLTSLVAELRAAQPEPAPGAAAQKLLALMKKLPKRRGRKTQISSHVKEHLYGAGGVIR